MYNVSPSWTNMGERIPPASADLWLPSPKAGIVTPSFTQNKWPIVPKNMEEGIIIEDVDGRSTWTVARGTCLLTCRQA